MGKLKVVCFLLSFLLFCGSFSTTGFVLFGILDEYPLWVHVGCCLVGLFGMIMYKDVLSENNGKN